MISLRRILSDQPSMPADSSPQVFTDVSVDPFVRGLLHRPANPNGSGLVLTHGAGSNCQAPLLVALAETFSAAGFVVLRCDLPYRQDRPYGPPGPGDAKRDRAGLKNAVAALKNLARGRVFLGGHSYGGGNPACSARNFFRKRLQRVPLKKWQDCSCSLILCILPENPTSSALSIFFICTPRRSLCKARAIPSARSQKSNKP